MLALLDKAVSIGILRPLDVYFAHMVASQDAPDILLAAACLSAAAGKGHVCLMLDQLQIGKLFSGLHPELAKSIWLAAGQPNSASWNQRLMACTAVSDGSCAKPIVLQGQRLYLHRMWKNESEVAEFFKSNCKYQVADAVQFRNILDRLFSVNGDTLDWQRIATTVAVTRKISVISGGPGTGKTTTVAKLLAALIQLDKHSQLRIQLAAPTGKAAARLSESIISISRTLELTSAQRALFPSTAATLHRLLGVQSYSQCSRYNHSNRLPLDVLVVDEASMIDLQMMTHLITALPKHARVIFLGDCDQLASVEAGAILGDICHFAQLGYSEDRAIELSRLTGCLLEGQKINVEVAIRDSLCLLRKSYRFNVKSGISQLASVVNCGNVVQAQEIINRGFNDVLIHSLSTTDEYHQLLSMCIAGYSYYLERVRVGDDAASLLETFSKFQVVCALHVGPLGVIGLNQQIECGLRNSGLIEYLSEGWYLGRPIMITRNDSALGLYNGDIGITLRDLRGELRVHFLLPDRTVKSIQISLLPAHETVYAMTVHKSQGSEFDHTVVVLLKYYLPLLTRELVYTAITRARNRLTLYAGDGVLMKAISAPSKRRSGLFERLRDI